MCDTFRGHFYELFIFEIVFRDGEHAYFDDI